MNQKRYKRNRLASILKMAKKDTVMPFTEKPSDEKDGQAKGKGSPVDAFGLFALFTADIIKEDVIFIR